MQRLKRQWSTIKKVMRSELPEQTAVRARIASYIYTSTTGRQPTRTFFYTQHDLDRLQASGHRLMQICQSQSDYRHINAFPFAPHLAFWQAHYAGWPTILYPVNGWRQNHWDRWQYPDHHQDQSRCDYRDAHILVSSTTRCHPRICSMDKLKTLVLGGKVHSACDGSYVSSVRK